MLVLHCLKKKKKKKKKNNKKKMLSAAVVIITIRVYDFAVQWTLVKTTAFVPKDIAIKMNLLL